VRPDRSALRAELESWLCEELGATGVTRLCPRCGGSDHGRPVLLGATGSDGRPSVSLSYADGLGVAAWTRDGAIGIDVEVVGPPVGEFGDRVTWTRTEAVLKATGDGVSRLPHDLPAMWSQELDLPAGWVGTVAVAGARAPVVSWWAAGPAATGRRARPRRER